MFPQAGAATPTSTSSSAASRAAGSHADLEEPPPPGAPGGFVSQSRKRHRCKEASTDADRCERESQKLFRDAVRREILEEAEKASAADPPLPRVVDPKQTYEHMRQQFQREYYEKKKAQVPGFESDAETVRSLRVKVRLLFSKLTFPERAALARRAATQGSLSEDARRDLENRAILLEAQHEGKVLDKKVWLHARTALLTYISANASSLNYMCPAEITTVEGAVRYLQRMTSLKAFFGEFVGWVEKTGEERLKSLQWAASVELCVDTFKKDRVLRVHLHAAWRSDREMWVTSPKALAFKGMIPTYTGSNIGGVSVRGSQDHLGAKGDNKTGRTGAQNAAFYYLQCEAKIGSVFRQGSNEPFVGYPIKAAWITTWVQVCFSTIFCSI